MKRRLAVAVITSPLVLSSVMQVLAAPGRSQTNTGEAAVREAAVRAIEANWNLLLDLNGRVSGDGTLSAEPC